MKKILLSFIFLSGCSAKNHLSVRNFETTNSLCLDALIVNMTSEGCTNMQHEQQESYVKITCQETNLGRWTEHEYYLFQTGTVIQNQDAQPLCSDMNISIGFSKINQ